MGLKRDLDTMSEAIALSSPSGKMSKQGRNRATERLRVSLFGKDGLEPPKHEQPTRKEYLLRNAQQLEALAKNGMKPRAYMKEAEKLRLEASLLKEIT